MTVQVATDASPKRPLIGRALGAALLLLAVAFPVVVPVPYYISTGITALMFVALAVAFDLVVGRIGALSLAQPLFFGFGAYLAALLNTQMGTPFALELLIVPIAACLFGVLVGIPSFRLSLHSFGIATLGFAFIGELIAKNWVEVTRGPMCVSGIEPMVFPLPGGSWVAQTITQQYWVILGITTAVVLAIAWMRRRGVHLAFTAVRDDPVLAGARGFWPNRFRIGAFAISAGITGTIGAYAAHFQTVVCPNSLAFAYTTSLLIMVFIGGRGSLRGVVAGALLFTVVPQLLRMADEWRLVLYGGVLLLMVTSNPDGLERMFQRFERGGTEE